MFLSQNSVLTSYYLPIVNYIDIKNYWCVTKSISQWVIKMHHVQLALIKLFHLRFVSICRG